MKYYVKKSFRCLTDEEIGRLQHLAIDGKKKVSVLAKQFGVSLTTAYSVVNAVPDHLVNVDKVGVGRWRRNAKKRGVA